MENSESEEDWLIYMINKYSTRNLETLLEIPGDLQARLDYLTKEEEE